MKYRYKYKKHYGMKHTVHVHMRVAVCIYYCNSAFSRKT